MTYHSPASLKSVHVSFLRTRSWIEAHFADTEAARIQGLHGRTSLAPNEGLLFHFPPQPPPIAMTMEKMLIPLDIIFIGDDMTIKHVARRVLPGRKRPVLGPAVPWVLEVPHDFARRHRLVLGDRAELVVR